MRRRARHRLIGAALLVLVGIVGFPMVFDTQPRPLPVGTRIEIPDRDKIAPLVIPAPVAALSVETPATPEPAQTPHEPEPKVAAAVPQEKAPAVPTAPVLPRKAPATEAFVEARSQPHPAKPETPVEAPSPVAPLGEADRARALLEGRAGKAPVAAATPAAVGAERFIVQVGAFSDESKVREARQKLQRAGLTTYTQVVETKDGKRTRVRVGPFQGRADAEKATAKIKGLGLPASILSL